MFSTWLTDLSTSTFDVLLGASTVDDRGVVLVDRDRLGLTEVLDRDVLELEAELFGDDLAAREDRHVLQHRLAAIAEAGCLNSTDVDRAADLVHDERGKGFTINVFRNEQKGLSGASNLLEEGKEVLHVARSSSRGEG